MEEFVILFHKMPADSDRDDHWDLMLRDEDTLLTWELAQNPLEFDSFSVRQLQNHRMRYLNFEGPLGNDRGRVSQVAKGQFRWLDRTDSQNWIIALNLNSEVVTFQLFSNREIRIQRNCATETEL